MYSEIHNRHDRRWFCECFTTNFHEEVTVTANWSKPTSRYEARSEAAEAGSLPDSLMISLFSFIILFIIYWSWFIIIGINSCFNVIKSCNLILCDNLYTVIFFLLRAKYLLILRVFTAYKSSYVDILALWRRNMKIS